MEVLSKESIYDGRNKNSFEKVAAKKGNPNYEKIIAREKKLYNSETDIRSNFQRDHNRIIHSNAFKRLRHKTQVYYSPNLDHICTRIEHVNLVESISYTIANEFGLNTELTRAIAVGHDIGHSPFGHAGEKMLNEIMERDVKESFWHEKNGLYLVDNIELLENKDGNKQNLYLTYAVRDGIVSHCGEIDENSVKPREEYIDLDDYKCVGQYQPYTWEGCVVKISDKISYIWRDIEDAFRFNILTEESLKELCNILKIDEKNQKKLNNTNIINDLSGDLLNNSSPEKGLTFSEYGLKTMNAIKAFNYKNIYGSDKLKQSHDYFRLVINKIYNLFKSIYDEEKKTIVIDEYKQRVYGDIIEEFLSWFERYTIKPLRGELEDLDNKKIFDIEKKEDYYKAIIIYISGMTDNRAIELFEEIIGF